MDTGFNYYHGADPSEYDLVRLELRRWARPSHRARRASRRGGLLGRRPGVLRAAGGREGDGRVLLRVRRQVPPGVDAAMVGEPSRASRHRLRARRPRLPGRRRSGAEIGDVPFNVFARRSRRPGSTSTSRAARTRRSPARRPAGRSSSPRPAPRSSRTRTRGIERWFEPGSEMIVRRGRRRRASPPTARCSTTRPRRRRWAPARASGCSTSTPIATARAGCSASSASRRRCR